MRVIWPTFCVHVYHMCIKSYVRDKTIPRIATFRVSLHGQGSKEDKLEEARTFLAVVFFQGLPSPPPLS